MPRRPLLACLGPARPLDHHLTDTNCCALTKAMTAADAYALAVHLRAAGWTVNVERTP